MPCQWAGENEHIVRELWRCRMAKSQMAKRPSRRVPEGVAATRDEIKAAIEALTPADWARLKRYAANRIRKLGPKADSRKWDDLLQIALQLLLDDTRRWDRTKVEFMPFMIWATRSISSNWARGYKPEETLALDLDVEKTNKDGETFQLMDYVEDDRPNPEQRVVDEEKRQADAPQLEVIDHLFKDDEQAQMVIEAWQDGYDPPGVRSLWNLSQKEHDTIVRRIRRTLNRAGLRNGEKHGQ